MPTLYPASELRVARWKVGVSLMLMSQALGYSVSLLSNVERGLLDRPRIVREMRKFLAAQASR